MIRFVLVLLISLIAAAPAACKNSTESKNELLIAVDENDTPIAVETVNGMKRAYFASGCFWCVEAIYESVKGVKEVISGYSGGHSQKPTYESSNTGKTGHAEAVEVIYDPEIVSFTTLVEVYFGSQNITQVNGQGPDQGSQYRSIIFYQNEEEKRIIDSIIERINKTLNGAQVAAQVRPFKKFWKAEDYHQDYEKLNPNNPYVQNVSIPRLKRFQAKFPELLKTEQEH